MAEDNRSIHKLYEKDKIGEVQIDVYKRQP